MTALCGGGASGPKPGVAETIIFTTSALASLLNNKGGGWAVVVAPLLGVLAYDATTFCASDPPADPGMTADDYAHLLHLDDMGAVATALGKLADLAQIAIWYEMCACTSVGTPAIPPAALLPPTGIGNPGGVGTAPCWSWGGDLYPGIYTSGMGSPADYITYPLPAGTHRSASIGPTGGTMITVDQVARPPAWTDITLRAEFIDTPVLTEQVTVQLILFSTSDTFTGPIAITEIGGPTNGKPPSKTVSGSLSIYPGRNFMALNVIQQNYATPSKVRVTLDAYCGVPSTSVAPCVSDPAAMALLQQIYNLLSLVQRQHVPFAYVPGSVHAALSGSGELAVSGLLGYTVELTTIPDYLGVTDETPDTVWSAGTTRYGTPDGWGERRWVNAPEVFVPVSGDVTRIGYTLASGVVATIREHVREP